MIAWNTISQIRKFTPIEEVFRIYGTPKFKLGDRQIYYMGDGVFLGYCEKKFRVYGMERKEYGEKGKYALSIAVFMKKTDVSVFYMLRQETYDFKSEQLCEPFEICEGISLNDTFHQISQLLRPRVHEIYYREGESRHLNTQRKFVFAHKWIYYGKYHFFFFGRFPKTPMSGFEYYFEE